MITTQRTERRATDNEQFGVMAGERLQLEICASLNGSASIKLLC